MTTARTLEMLLLLLLTLTLTRGLAAQASSSSLSYPASVEFDVVFPRNDSYAPTTLLPIVFAIQNPQVAGPLLAAIEWTIWPLGGSPDGPLADRSIDLTQVDFSTRPNPYFVADSWSTAALNQTEGAFSLLWTLVAGNCSGSFPFTQLGAGGASNHTLFTIQNGAQPASLVSGPGRCPAQSLTFNVTGTVLVEPNTYNGRNACAVVADARPPASPCAIQVGTAVAASISASITASLCAAPRPIITGCPAPANKTSWAVGGLTAGGLSGIGLAGAAVGSWLALLVWALP